MPGWQRLAAPACAVRQCLFMLALDYLLNLQVLFWFGWIFSSLVFVCFVVRCLPDLFLNEERFLDSTPRSPSHFSSSKFRSSTTLLITLVVLFVVAFMNRYFLSGFMLGPWFFFDEALDSCIIPFQVSQGESIWGGSTYNLVHLIRLMAYRLFGFSPAVARTTNMVFFAASVIVFYWALLRPFGREVAWAVVGMMLLSSPFIVQSIYATVMTFCLLPSAFLLWILTRPLTQTSSGLLGVALVAGLYLYAAAFLTGVCLVFFHAIVFYRNWTWRTRSITLVTFAFSWGLARLVLTGNPSWRRWGGGELSFDEQIGQRSIVVLKDVFWESLSFNSLNLRAPYFDSVMVGFLIIGIIASLIIWKPQPSMFERKWVWISLLSFFGSVFLSALALHNPGVRRILSSLPLLFLIAGLGLKYLWNWRAFRPLVGGAIIVCFGLVAFRSYVIGKTSWPLAGDSDFMVGARQALLQNTNSQKNVVIIGYNTDQWGGELYRCALSLDENLNTHFQTVIVIPRPESNQKQDLQGEFILLANELFLENQLQDIFGHAPTSSKIRKQSKLPHHGELVAIYDFTKNSVRQ